MNPIAMTMVLVLSAGFFAWSANRRWQLLRVGAPEPRFSIYGSELIKRIEDTFVYAFGQKKMPYYFVAGIAHMMIFAGFGVLLLRSVMLWGRGFDPTFDVWGIFGAGTLIGDGYNVIKDIFGALVVVGALVFVYYRVIKKDQRMTLSGEGLLILGIIISMMVADMTYDGASEAMHARIAGEAVHFNKASPVGSIFAMAFQGMSNGTLNVLAHTGFWWHSSFVLIFLNILPFSKHFHIITSIPNVFARPHTPRGQLPMVEDIEGKVEREEPIGIAKITDLSWKHILDLYTCTECGRCSDNCPAYITGKKLSPKHLTLALRDHLYDTEAHYITGSPNTKGHVHEAGVKEGLHTNPPPPEDAYFREHAPVELVPNIIHPDVIWACTSCRACEEQCPVMISYVDKIVGMRREQVMIKNEFPAELMKPFNALETNGNPWNYSKVDRANWSDGLNVPLVGDAPDVDVIYWVGCAASYDDRAKKVARATAKLLKHANIKFAILGTDETCTGDPARRAGNEYLFQILAQQNVETLNSAGADKKVVLTTCPHCFNAILNDYPQFGGKYDVVHHTDFLNGLVARGVLKPEKPVEGRVAFHDSCYLGRYNDVYQSPRSILQAIPGVELVEVPYWNKNKGLCCGAGGAQMFMEEQNENRVNVKRTLQLIDTGAKTISSACPFCMTMLTDGIKSQDKEDQIAQMDVAEMLALSVNFGDEAVADAAE
ncbi:MAG: (Fe-S)-binding protein [Sandaracinaceae bacterium]|nr:(Fe-S)-binding protein [Sandaracinaceae bacterium]